MSDVIKYHKVVASLPGTLDANSVYYVRVGTGVDVYVSNDMGIVTAYALNPPSAGTILATELVGLDTAATPSAIVNGDTIIDALGKIQAQLNDTSPVAAATKLATARSISITGDATWTTSFDGSTNVTGALTLANSGVTAGTYPKVTVDVKGRVTAGAVLVAADIPALDASKITSGTFAAARIPTLNQNTTGSAATLTTARTISITGDATWTTSFNGSANVTGALTLANSGVTAGTYPKVTVDAKGRVTSGDTLVAADIPALDASKITSGVLADAHLSGTYTGVNITGNAATATKLATARTISVSGAAVGFVNFDGSSNAEIVTTTPRVTPASDPTSTFRADVFGGVDDKIKVLRAGASGYLNFPQYSPCLAWSTSDTHAFFSPTYYSPRIRVGAGSGTGITWQKDLAFTDSNITGNAATATKLQTARSIALAGDVTGSATFDGSSNVSITATVADDSHTHDTRYPVLSAERVLAAVPAGSWVTIAQVPSNGGRAYGEFIVYDTDSGKHNAVKIIASHSYGQSVVACIGGNRFGTRTIAHVRVLYGTADRTYDGAKLQVYIESTCSLRVRALMINQINGWSAWSEMTPVVEGTPAGWAEDTTTRYDDITNTATGFSGSFSGSGTLLTGLNAANLASGTIPDARLSGTYTGVNITGNAATATKLQTARTINGVAFDGSANITVADSTKLPLTGGTLTGTLTGTRGVFTGTGNDYNLGGLEVIGNGNNNTVFPTIGFHQPGLYASSIQLRAGSDFRFYANGGTSYANVTAARFNGSAAGLTDVPASQMSGIVPDANLSGTYTGVNITGNASTATALQTARTINGVSFNGTANITVADATKLPLAGGTLTGPVLFAGNGPGNGIQAGNGDNASSTINNLKLTSWFGIGFGPSISDQPVPLGEYSHWMNVRNGDMGIRGSFTASGNITAYSDIRLKTDIQVIPDALAKVEHLRGVTYTRIETGERQTGVIAQEVQKVLPEAVIQGEEYLSVAYGNMVGLLIESIKELSAKVKLLEAKLEGQ